jgi:signal transduction histidine kinase
VLLLGYRRIAGPLFELLRQGREILAGKRERFAFDGGWDEVQGLADFTGTLLDERMALEHKNAGLKGLLGMSEGALVALHRKGGRDAMLHAFCRNLAVRGDYCLVWIGEPDGHDFMPVAADGSTTMSGDECKACVAELLGVVDDDGPDSIQLQEALQGKRAVVRHDILAGLPKGPFKNTPLRDNPVSCAAVPVFSDGTVRYVISIYAISPGCFGVEEMTVLGMLAGELAHALVLQEEKEAAGMSAAGHPILYAARLASIGELATGIAHEISNLSNGVINYAQLLADDVGSSINEEQHSLLAKIIKEGERIARTAGNILDFQNDQEGGPEPLQIEKIVADTLALVGQQFRNDGIEVIRHFQDGLPAVSANGHHLQYVYLNLLNNAREGLNAKFPGKDGAKRLEIVGEVVRKRGASWLRTMMTDYGPGIAASDIPRVFDSDFIVKPSGRAAGFGFSISRELVGRYGGEISIESKEGEFTAVMVDFPLKR